MEAVALGDISPAEDWDDSAVVARCRRGDRAALGELVSLYQDRVYGLCLRLCGDREAAADLAQETFVRAVGSIERFDERARFFTWLYRIAVNLSIDRRRRESRRPAVSIDAAGGDGEIQRGGSIAERLTGSDPRPDQRAARAEQHRIVAAAVQELDDEFRAVVVLRDIDGLDYAEIAEVLDVPVGTVKSRLFRARMMLREKLRPLIETDQ
jgi:RNA polymerase sigma-70 factor (ECF subfamily)